MKQFDDLHERRLHGRLGGTLQRSTAGIEFVTLHTKPVLGLITVIDNLRIAGSTDLCSAEGPNGSANGSLLSGQVYRSCGCT